ncbi:MAG: type II toxin-antitoxin system prevent-host-death family antitoxin [Propionibacteriaceae bacterium]|jgi:prevent-host-death family protein|nr:type II toxin-antitoxin system prevent-host-death family antitoxin [Propionibacteriaceae bacterium]
MTATFGAYEAKTHFSRLLDDVVGGQTVLIVRHGVPVARLVPARPVPGDPAQVVAGFQQARRGLRLDGLSLRQLISEGRK